MQMASDRVSTCVQGVLCTWHSRRIEVEARHKLGFTSRVIMTPTARAIVCKDTGLLDADIVSRYSVHEE